MDVTEELSGQIYKVQMMHKTLRNAYLYCLDNGEDCTHFEAIMEYIDEILEKLCNDFEEYELTAAGRELKTQHC